MKVPEQIAFEIVDGLRFNSNRMKNGRLIGEQYFAAEEITKAIADERNRYIVTKAALCEAIEVLAGIKSGRLKPRGKRSDFAIIRGKVALKDAEN